MSASPYYSSVPLHVVAKERALVRTMERVYLATYNNFMAEGKYEEVSTDPEFLAFARALDQRKKSKVASGWFITINPRVDDIEKLKSTMKRILTYKKFIDVKYYAFDQREPYNDLYPSVSQNFRGFHLHIYAEDTYTKSKSEVIKRVYNAVKAEFKNIEHTKACVDVKHADDKCIPYIKGEKKVDDNPDKELIIKNTKLWLAKYRLPQFIECLPEVANTEPPLQAEPKPLATDSPSKPMPKQTLLSAN